MARSDIFEAAGAAAARKERRRRLSRLILGLGAAGVAAYAGSRFLRQASQPEAAPATPSPLPPVSNGSSRFRKAMGYAAIPAGIGLAALGGRFALPAIKSPSALFGKNIARLARKNGVFSVYDKLGEKRFLKGLGEVSSGFDNLLNRILRRKSTNKTPGELKSMAKRLGRVFEGDALPSGAVKSYDFNPAMKKVTGNAVGAVSSERARRMWDNKEFQRKMLELSGAGGLMPAKLSAKDKSWLMDQLSRAAKSGKAKEIDDTFINNLLKQRTGKDWFIKELSNTSSRNPLEPQFFKGYFENIRNKSDFNRLFKNITINEYRPSEEMSNGWRRFFNSKFYKNHVAKHLPEADNFGYGYGLTPLTEYRVHVANGKVVPFATSDRHNPLTTWSTFRTGKKARIEAKVQEAFDKMVEYQKKHPGWKGFKPGELDLRKQVFGLDVGLDRFGNPTIYELNPTMGMKMHAGSGHLLFPEHRDSYISAIKGLPSKTQILQLLLGGGATAAGTGMAVKGVRDVSGNS